MEKTKTSGSDSFDFKLLRVNLLLEVRSLVIVESLASSRGHRNHYAVHGCVIHSTGYGGAAG